MSRSPTRQGGEAKHPSLCSHLAFSRPSFLASYLPEAQVQRGARELTLILNACC